MNKWAQYAIKLGGEILLMNLRLSKNWEKEASEQFISYSTQSPKNTSP